MHVAIAALAEFFNKLVNMIRAKPKTVPASWSETEVLETPTPDEIYPKGHESLHLCGDGITHRLGCSQDFRRTFQ